MKPLAEHLKPLGNKSLVCLKPFMYQLMPLRLPRKLEIHHYYAKVFDVYLLAYRLILPARDLTKARQACHVFIYRKLGFML
jgi:hypothetical protein